MSAARPSGQGDYAALRAQLDGRVPDGAQRQLVLVDTPARLFKFAAPAILNAIDHATGKRIRELPATPDKLL